MVTLVKGDEVWLRFEHKQSLGSLLTASSLLGQSLMKVLVSCWEHPRSTGITRFVTAVGSTTALSRWRGGAGVPTQFVQHCH